MTAALALTTCVLFGLADFGGGLLSRRLPTLTVVVGSQALAACVLGVAVATTGAWQAATDRLWFAVAAGLLGPPALLCFYRALAMGPMGVVAPLTAVEVVVPLGVGLVLLGERPGPLQYAGLALALTGVVLAGGPQRGGGRVRPRTVVLTLVSAMGFGTLLVLLAEASTTGSGLLLALFVQRLCNLLVGGAILAAGNHRGVSPLPRDGVRGLRAALPGLAFIGVADVVANGTYALAYRWGPVTVAAVLASLYPVVTAVAARTVLGERLRGIQATGAALAMTGSILLATG